MVIDYKGVSFSFEKIKQKKRLQRIRLLLLIVVLIIVYLIFSNTLDYNKIKKIQTLMVQSKIKEATELLEKTQTSIFHPNTKKELEALILLFNKDYPQAKQIFDSLLNKSTLVEVEEFLNYFSDQALYQQLDLFTDYLSKKRKKANLNRDLKFYQLQAKTALMDHQQSSVLINQLPTEFKKEQKKALTQIKKVNDQIKNGKLYYIYDINGNPLAYYDIKDKTTKSLIPGINFTKFKNEIKDCIKFFRLTLDKNIQIKVHRAFHNFHGSFLLMRTNDSSIISAYSKPIDQSKKGINTVFSEVYEPGSIIKLLTMYTYLNSGIKDDFFPLSCQGLLEINSSGENSSSKKIFYDWKRHNEVNSCEEALAVSCNIALAKIGIQLGADAIKKTLNQFYFHKQSNPISLTDLFFQFNTGYYNDISSAEPFRLAQLSVGLEEIYITTFHSALISTIISQNGSISEPYMIKNKKNLLNIAFYNHTSPIKDIFKANTVFLKIKSGMEMAVEDEKGTGRRSRVEFVKVALKTGTAGNKKLGLDAVLTGFFPSEKPQFAFAIRLERAGKAEWKGALFLKTFLTYFYQDNQSIQK